MEATAGRPCHGECVRLICLLDDIPEVFSSRQEGFTICIEQRGTAAFVRKLLWSIECATAAVLPGTERRTKLV